jgi:predicted TIM-barrel fold metal-dependent hydrolase
MSPPAMLDSHLHLWDLAVRDQAWIAAGSPIRRSFDVGIRHQDLVGADPAGWLRSPGVRRSLAILDAAGLPFDLMIRRARFPAARKRRATIRPAVRA